MAWQQLQEPVLDPVIYYKGEVLRDWYGWCLLVVRSKFNLPLAGGTAWKAWNNYVSNRHEDRNLPTGVYVFIWFAGYAGQGHVALYKDGHIWSSPYRHKPTNDEFNSIAEVERIYHVTYVGWSDNLAGVQIAKYQADQAPYTITPIEPKRLHVQANHYKWNLAQPDFNAVVTNPITTSGDGYDFTAVAVLKRSDPGFANYTYYLDDGNTPHGWNALDCAEPITAPMPTPYIPPTAPNKGTPAEKYELLTTLPYYASAEAAQAGKDNSTGKLPAGIYYVISKENKAYNISSDNMKDLQHWVNTLDNKAPVEIPVTVKTLVRDDSWKSTRVFFHEDRNKYDTYELQLDVIVQDLDHKGQSFFVSAYKPNSSDNAILKVYGTVSKDTVKYYLLHDPKDVNWDFWYVVPIINAHTGKPYLLKYSELYDTTPKYHSVTLSEQTLEAFAKLGYQVWDIVRKLPIIRNIK
jgi:hypothetical protein